MRTVSGRTFVGGPFKTKLHVHPDAKETFEQLEKENPDGIEIVVEPLWTDPDRWELVVPK